MNEESLAKEIKKEVIVKNFERYFEILEKSVKVEFKDTSWKKGQALYNSIDDENKENLKEFIKMVMIESVGDLLSFVDDITRFSKQTSPLELFYDGKKISGSLQENLLMDIEDNGI